jgi:multiple antibiotic resistance protein
MNFDLSSFIHYVFIGFVALFPVVNPLGTAFIVSPYFSDLTSKERSRAVKKITLYVFILSFVVLVTGHWILELFGISIPIIQLAGGIMICKIGWDFLSPAKTNEKKDSSSDDASEKASIDNQLFYPITFPMTAGAGTISVLFTLSAHDSDKNISSYLINTGAILVAVIGMCILVFFCYVNANKLINYLGSHREKVINSIMAFLIFCVGLQIAVQGIQQLIK